MVTKETYMGSVTGIRYERNLGELASLIRTGIATKKEKEEFEKRKIDLQKKIKKNGGVTND